MIMPLPTVITPLHVAIKGLTGWIMPLPVMSKPRAVVIIPLPALISDLRLMISPLRSRPTAAGSGTAASIAALDQRKVASQTISEPKITIVDCEDPFPHPTLIAPTTNSADAGGTGFALNFQL